MTPVRLSDLPASVRQQVLEATGTSPAPQEKSRKGVGLSVPCPGRCGTCGEVFGSALAWEKHAKTTGCSRWNITLGAG